MRHGEKRTLNTQLFCLVGGQKINKALLSFQETLFSRGGEVRGVFPVFTFLGNPLHMDLRNAYLYS